MEVKLQIGKNRRGNGNRGEQNGEQEGSAQSVLKSGSSPRPPLSQALNLTASRGQSRSGLVGFVG